MMSLKLPQNDLPVTMLRNLRPASAMMLAEVGIRTIGELRVIGAAKAYVRVRGGSYAWRFSQSSLVDGCGA